MKDQTIGKYRVLRQIGAGGMASVFLAVHKDVPSLHVVLKRLGDPDLVERFKREADKLAALDGHPGICQIKHFFDHDGVFYIAMEYIDGQTLQDLVESHEKLEVGRALFMGRTILDILETAHTRGICHRDIKPTNIMIDGHDNLKIIDFGLAKADSDPHLTNIGTSLGSPLYMAPEQFNPREDLDFVRCDIYAVGICLYFMLTGKLPFGGNNLVQIIEAKTQSEIVPPSEHNPEIPAGLEAAILTSIARNPAERFASVAEMKVALVSGPVEAPAVQDAGEATVALDTDQLPGRPPARQQESGSKSRTMVFAAMALAAVLAVVGWQAGLFSSGNTGPQGDAQLQADREAAADSAAKPPVGIAEEARPGKLTLLIQPEGDVYLDGELQDRGQTRTTLEMAPGPHDIVVENPGSEEKSWSRNLQVAAGDSMGELVEFTMVPTAEEGPAVTEQTPPPAPTGELVVGSLPVLGAEIFINGEDTNHTTPFTLTLDAGQHLVKVVLVTDGVAQEREENILVEAGQSQKKIFRFN